MIKTEDGSNLISQSEWENQLEGVSKLLDLVEEIRDNGNERWADKLEDCIDFLLYE